MNIWPALLSGLGFGLVIAIPFGPMSLLCMNRTLQRGFWAGLATGAGIAFADATYALITVYGFRMVNELTADYAQPLRIIGSLFLGWLGAKALLSGGRANARPDSHAGGVTYSMMSAFLLTLANPATILSFMALSATLGTKIGTSPVLPVGIALGSCLWWILLTGIIYWISGKMPATFTRYLGLASATF